MGLVTNEEVCEVVWGIIIKNVMHKYSFLVNDLLCFYLFQEHSGRERSRMIICLPFDVGGSSVLSVLRYSHPTLMTHN